MRAFSIIQNASPPGVLHRELGKSKWLPRMSGNDTWKLWIGGELVRECPDEGRIILDREILPVSLPAGTTSILLKVCNNRRDWGFVLRITDLNGRPVPGLKVGLNPQ